MSRDSRVYLAFVGLALLAGPIDGYSANSVLVATAGQVHAGIAVASLLGGAALMLFGHARERRDRSLAASATVWGVPLLLLAPQWAWLAVNSLSGSAVWLHGVGGGVLFLIALDAPLWLALVGSLEVAAADVPVACVAAAVAGMGAALLVLPAESYAVRWNQVAMLLLAIATGVATALTWVIARRRIAGLSLGAVAALAGRYLLLNAAGEAVLSWLKERPSWQPMDWHTLAVPVLCEAALLAGEWWLWFWLLRRITLGAFGMRVLAAWAATALPGFVTVGLLSWRVDLAFVIALAAVVAGVRARVEDDQPTVLGLGGP